MARIIKKGRDLEREYQNCQDRLKWRKIVIFLCIGVGVLAVLAMQLLDVTRLIFVPAVCVIVGIVTAASAAPVIKEVNILEAGIQGENEASRCLSLLPDNYTVFRNLTVSYQGKSSEMDAVVVGPTGVFVVEIKNLNGSIYGRVEDAQWRQEKVGRGGTPYGKNFYSPIKQVNTHVYRLAKYLQERNVRAYVNACVYFANSLAMVSVVGDSGKTAVFSAGQNGGNLLLARICTAAPTGLLPMEECGRIVRILEQA